MIEQNQYPLFKGLQKPLEFMGLRGRFIYLAAGAVMGAFMCYVIGSIISGSGLGAIMALVVGGGTLVYLLILQKKGLYARKKFRGVVVYNGLRKNVFK